MDTIDKSVLEEKKQSLKTDIEKIEQTITQLAEQQKQIQANLSALHGAVQQCDQFLELLEEKEEVQ